MPDRLVAEEFRATRIVTLDGVALTGLIVKEDPTEIEVLLPDATRKTLKPADIESRTAVATSPMPSGRAALRKNRWWGRSSRAAT